MPGKLWIAGGGIIASLAVAAGAIGAHLLKETYQWPAADLETYEVAVRNQMAHALGLIVVGLLLARGRCRWIATAGALFAIGIALFSGGIYAYLATGQKPFVHVVPFGGVSLIVGWILLAIGAATQRPERRQ